LFGLLAGALSACGLNIVSAETVTRRDGTCIDSFLVVDSHGKLVSDEGRWRRVERMLERVLSGQQDLEVSLSDSSASGRSKRGRGRGEERVEVRNDLSERATVVEVVTFDRPGLVYDITRILSDFHLDLKLAKIATRNDLASDTFYVVGRGGRQVGSRRCRQLTRALEEHFA
jgi:[protein-PII] uridylyltransferase